jgi:hypothetical protein
MPIGLQYEADIWNEYYLKKNLKFKKILNFFKQKKKKIF